MTYCTMLEFKAPAPACHTAWAGCLPALPLGGSCRWVECLHCWEVGDTIYLHSLIFYYDLSSILEEIHSYTNFPTDDISTMEGGIF